MRILVVAVVLATVVAACGLTSTVVSTPTATVSPPPSPRWARVADMTVVTVAEAAALAASGELDGRAVAIAGFWAEFTPPCPAPDRNIAALEGWCAFNAFADTDPRLCQPVGDNGVSCDFSRSGPLKPILVDETSRQDGLQRGDEAQPRVVIGHMRDPRLWHCAPDTRDACARALVVDYIAEPDQPSVEIRPPDTGVSPRLSLPEAAAAAGVDPDAVIAAAAVRASAVANIDPRFNFAGNDPIWVLRAIRPTGTPESPARPVSVILVDDKTGTVVGEADLTMPADFQPARLAIDVRRPPTNGSDGIGAIYSVERPDGTEIGGAVIGGQFGTPQKTQHGPGTPLILPPGDYVITAGLVTIGGTGVPIGEPLGDCSQTITLAPLDNVEWSAGFPDVRGSCEWLSVVPDAPMR